MRLLFSAIILAFFVHSPLNAQSCESLSIRNAAGQVTGIKQVCVDANGAWIDPAKVGQQVQPAIQPSVQSLAQPVVQPVVLPIVEPAPSVVYSEPLPAPEIISVPQPDPWPQPVITTEVEAPLPSTTSRSWQPTSGLNKREQLYAKLGLVCKARNARFCDGNDCAGLCVGKQGWCDGKTGEVYPSLEAIERVYCRKKKRR